MAVFISYAHADSAFVNRLADELVKNRTHIWLDHWELNAGDSIVQKIQEAIKDAYALLVILSKSSVESEWCKKELSVGLIRELDEKRVVVIPVLLEDCVLPTFLRDKMYADFRTSFDDGLHHVLKALSPITSDSTGRNEGAEVWHDWSIDWGESDGRVLLRITAACWYEKQPYSILTMIDIEGNRVATERYNMFASRGLDWFARHVILEYCYACLSSHDSRLVISGDETAAQQIQCRDQRTGTAYTVDVRCRRLGEDTGGDVLTDYCPIVQYVYHTLQNRSRQLTAAETQELASLLLH